MEWRPNILQDGAIMRDRESVINGWHSGFSNLLNYDVLQEHYDQAIHEDPGNVLLIDTEIENPILIEEVKKRQS